MQSRAFRDYSAGGFRRPPAFLEARVKLGPHGGGLFSVMR